MTQEEIDSGNSSVSFTITLPQKFADEITQRAKYKALKAEEMLQMEIISYIERKERILNDIRRGRYPGPYRIHQVNCLNTSSANCRSA